MKMVHHGVFVLCFPVQRLSITPRNLLQKQQYYQIEDVAGPEKERPDREAIQVEVPLSEKILLSSSMKLLMMTRMILPNVWRSNFRLRHPPLAQVSQRHRFLVYDRR